MKAIVYRKKGSGSALEIGEFPVPSPGADEVLIRVRAAAFNALDRYFFPMEGTWRWWRRTGRPGTDFAGEITAIGSAVTSFETGSAVFGAVRGALSEYVTIKADRIARKPENATIVQAGALGIAGLTALQGLRDVAKLRAGQRVLVVGAAGGVGSFAVQIAKAMGASVTAVTSMDKMSAVATLGADRVLDYTRDAFLSGEVQYDVIVDCGGVQPLGAFRRALVANGVYVGVGANMKAPWALVPRLISMVLLSAVTRKKMRFFLARSRSADLDVLRGMVEAHAIQPLVPRVYPFTEAATALRDFQSGRAFGKVVVSIP